MKLKYGYVLKNIDVDKIIVESYDQCLYQCFLEHEGREKLIWGDDGHPMTTFSLTEMRKLIFPLNPSQVFLRQNSAYDEMIGQPQGGVNTMLVPLAVDSICF